MAASDLEIYEGLDTALRALLGPVLGSLTPEQHRVMEYAALLPPDHVPLPWLRTLMEQDFPVLSSVPCPADPFDDLIGHLERLALLTRPPDAAEQHPRLRRVHRMVQQVVLSRLPEEEKASLAHSVEQLVDARNAFFNSTHQWQDARWELEPFAALADKWAEDKNPRAAWLANQAAFFWHGLADYTRTEPLMRRALAMGEASFGKDHPKVAIRLNNLARLLQDTNRLAEAEPLMRRALAMDEASFGKDHSDVAIDLNNLATLHKETDRLAEAEPMMKGALRIMEDSLGREHPNSVTVMKNLAILQKEIEKGKEP